MKKIILLLFVLCIFIEVFAQIEKPVRASVIAIDKLKNTVYVRKIDAGNIFSFSVEKEQTGKFQPGKIVGIRFEAKTVITSQEDRIKISDLVMPLERAGGFSIKVRDLNTVGKSNPAKNQVPYKIWKMTTVPDKNDESSTLIRACCEERTANGVEFMIPAGITITALEQTVYIYNDLVFTDQSKDGLPVLVFPVSGNWIDSARQADTIHQSKSQLKYDLKDNIKARPNTSEREKWIITPVATMKGVLGGLDINFPGVDRDILIYRPADNKFITSVSDNAKSYTIAPGEYRFTLTNVPVDNVPIQKGHETRLKAGYLNIVSEGKWHLYDDTKKKAFTSGNKPKKLALPVGSYQLKLGLEFYPVLIKDGEVTEF